MNHRTLLVTFLTIAMTMFGGTALANNGAGTTPAAAGSVTNMFGGPIYDGKPALAVTAALVKAGGGAQDFSFSRALVSMLGKKTVNAEVAKLQKQYGKDEVATFITGMDYAVKDGLKQATEAGIKLPAAPANLHGLALAHTLVTAGTSSDGVWWSGYLFDHALSHGLHNKVMDDINNQVSAHADMTTHRILNQAMYDVAHALGQNHVKLASLH